MKVISGGQIGVDQGALQGAKACGLETGGTMPRGFLTRAGAQPWLAATYGLTEHRLGTYPPRTKQNVADADATVWLGGTGSNGYFCTLKATWQCQKPFVINPSPTELRRRIAEHGWCTVNFAGPSDPEWTVVAAEFVKAVFQGGADVQAG